MQLHTGKSPKVEIFFLENWAKTVPKALDPYNLGTALKNISKFAKARDFEFGTQIHMGKSPSAV